MTTQPLDQSTSSRRASYGIFLMVLGLGLYALSDAFIKHFNSYYSVFQVTFLRALTRLIPLLICLSFTSQKWKLLKCNRVLHHGFRLLVNVVYTFTFMYAYSIKTLTDVYTISYSSPFFMILLSAFVLKEQIEFKKWLSVLVGFVGIIIAIKPTLLTFERISFIVLFGTFLGCLNKVLMKNLTETENTFSITIYPNLVMILFIGPMLFGSWEPMPLIHWGLYLAVGVIAAMGQWAIAEAFRHVQSSLLAPFDYTTLIWALLFDFFWWQEIPSFSTLIGAGIVIGANLSIIYYTRKDRTARDVIVD